MVAPYPDDEALGCGGTIMRHIVGGDSVAVLIVTDGRRSRAHNLQADAMAKARQQEARAAAGLLGIDEWIWLGCQKVNGLMANCSCSCHAHAGQATWRSLRAKLARLPFGTSSSGGMPG